MTWQAVTEQNTGAAAADWSGAEKRAWHWPERLRPSDWIEKNVIIPDNGFNPEPGPYSFDRTPHWREVVDTTVDPTVQEVWAYKPNQSGFTQLMMAWAAYCAAQDPGAMGLLLPGEDDVDELFNEQLKPLIEASPATRKLKSGRAWDSTKHELWLSTMPILGIYSGSSGKLEKRPFRYIIGDEINLYQDISGEASAIQRALKRITTWQHRGKAIFGSKPTTTEGNITQGFESCPDKRHYFMPCMRCGRFHDWLWSQVKGFKEAPGNDKWERANWVKLNQAAHYECPLCRKITTEAERMTCVRAGRWVSGTKDGDKWVPVQSVTDDGRVLGERPPARRVGFWNWAVVLPWVKLHDLAGEFIESEGDADRTQGFRNARLALPYHQVVRATRPSVVRDKKAYAPPPLIVPKWTTGLFTTVDVQKDWARYVIRAWGAGFKSQGVTDGFIYEANAPVAPEKQNEWFWNEVYRIGLQSRFAVEGEEGKPSNAVAGPPAMLIDSGDGARTAEIYAFAARDPRILPTKGLSYTGRKMFFPTEPRPGVRLWMVDTIHFKGALWSLLHDADLHKWMPHRDVNEQYCLEMAGESLVKIKGKWVWQENGTARVETWDCEVLQRAAAEMFNSAVGTSLEQQQAMAKSKATATGNGEGFNPFKRAKKW